MELLSHKIYPRSFPDFNSLLTEWLVLFTCFGYPLQAMVVLYSGENHTLVNYFFRSGYLIISLYLILFSLYIHLNKVQFSIWTKVKTNISFFAFILFWILYGIRIINDLEFKGLDFGKVYVYNESIKQWHWEGMYHKYYVYSWAFGCSLIPALSILLNAYRINIKRLTSYLLYFLYFSNLFLAIYILYSAKNNLENIFSIRNSILLNKNDSGFNTDLINSITISYYGEILALSILTYSLFNQNRFSIISKLLLIIGFLLGFFNLLAGASRGPVIECFIFSIIEVGISILAFVFINHKSFFLKSSERFISDLHKYQGSSVLFKQSLTKILLLCFSLIILFTTCYFVSRNFSLKTENFALIKRLKVLDVEKINNTTDYRIKMWKSALHQFKVNPVFGDSFINNEGNFYSHNIFLDALMSVGIVGSILFLIYILSPFYYFIRLPGEKKRLISILFVVFLAALGLSMTSGGLFTVTEVWILSAALIGISKSHAKK